MNMYMYLLYIFETCPPFKCYSNFMTFHRSAKVIEMQLPMVYYMFIDKNSPVKLNPHPRTPEFINLQVCK